MERVKGIEPSYEAWEAAVLPLNYTRSRGDYRQRAPRDSARRASRRSMNERLEDELRDGSDAMRPRIRSFVVRAGRMGPGQARALADARAALRAAVSADGRSTSPAIFGRDAPLVLEIGFGMGEATAAIARRMPDTDFLGVEVHPPGVGALLKRIGEHGLTNMRIVQHDAVEVLEHMIAPGSLAGVHVFFPDPWHKKRHNKRRLIQPRVRRACSRAASRRAATCIARPTGSPTRSRCSRCCRPSPRCANTAEGYAPRPAYRPLTKFENRGLSSATACGTWCSRSASSCRGAARPRAQPCQSTSPLHAVASTTMPNAMRYQANGMKSCVRDVAQQPAHAEPRADEREHQPDGEQRQVGHRQQRALLVQAVDAGADQRRDARGRS